MIEDGRHVRSVEPGECGRGRHFADLIASDHAVEQVRLASNVLGGKGGGGRADLAQTGGLWAPALHYVWFPRAE